MFHSEWNADDSYAEYQSADEMYESDIPPSHHDPEHIAHNGQASGLALIELQ